MMPSHIAIIMDGNGRWANRRGKQRFLGHEAGVQAVKMVIEQCLTLGIPYLTLYAFSIENMTRPEKEKKFIADLFEQSLYENVKKLASEGVDVRILGDASSFSQTFQEFIENSQEAMLDAPKLRLNICYNYSGRWHIEQVFNRLKEQEVSERSINEAFLADLGSDPDLLIRTGGERRLSNFALWNLAYSEIYFSDVLWPDFSSDDFQQALNWYKHRERRFGQVVENVTQ